MYFLFRFPIHSLLTYGVQSRWWSAPAQPLKLENVKCIFNLLSCQNHISQCDLTKDKQSAACGHAQRGMILTYETNWKYAYRGRKVTGVNCTRCDRLVDWERGVSRKFMFDSQCFFQDKLAHVLLPSHVTRQHLVTGFPYNQNYTPFLHLSNGHLNISHRHTTLFSTCKKVLCQIFVSKLTMTLFWENWIFFYFSGDQSRRHSKPPSTQKRMRSTVFGKLNHKVFRKSLWSILTHFLHVSNGHLHISHNMYNSV